MRIDGSGAAFVMFIEDGFPFSVFKVGDIDGVSATISVEGGDRIFLL